MTLHTASEVISFAKQLESDSAGFYERLCDKFNVAKNDLLCFAKENRKNMVQIERTYYGGITDAIEGCFAFAIEPDKYLYEAALSGDTSLDHALNQAVEMENRIMGFYSDAAQQSKSLLADISRAFNLIVKKRKSRESKLKSLVGKEA